MTSLRLHRLPFLLAFVVSAASGQPRAAAPVPEFSISPALVEAGAPELVHLADKRAVSIDGEWLGRKLRFVRGPGGRGWYALAGVDVEAPLGPSALTVHIHDANGAVRDLSRDLEIHAARYRTATLSVDSRFVEPGPDELKQIEAESQFKEKIFAASTAEPLWIGSFRAPVTARPTDSFGTRRMFNGKLASIHKGADFHAPTGTPVRAGNNGVVVLARPLYYEGNCVIIDHGMGLFTLSMHFSRIDVQEGQRVTKGQQLGLSGATGRVTGPHLHWAVRWEGAYLDPLKLLRMNLSGVR